MHFLTLMWILNLKWPWIRPIVFCEIFVNKFYLSYRKNLRDHSWFSFNERSFHRKNHIWKIMNDFDIWSNYYLLRFSESSAMYKKLEIGFREQILVSIKGVKMKSRIMTKNYAIDSVIQVPTKSILRCMVFTEHTHQRGS